MNGFLNFSVYCLACYRLATLASFDICPFGLCEKFRRFLKRESKEPENKILRKSKMADGISCLRCSSLQLAIPLALFKCFHAEIPYWISLTGDVVIYGLALSAAAVLLHRVMPPK